MTQIFQFFLIACSLTHFFHILTSAHITTRSKTLIGNIFSNACDPTFKSGNLLTTGSDRNALSPFLENQTKTNKERQHYGDFTAMEK